MIAVDPGQSIRCSVAATQFGAPVDPPTLTLTLLAPDNSTIVISGNNIVRDATGDYHADALIPVGAVPGPWQAIWIATGAAVDQNGRDYVNFTVRSRRL